LYPLIKFKNIKENYDIKFNEIYKWKNKLEKFDEYLNELEDKLQNK
jgi:hypothetical protein